MFPDILCKTTMSGGLSNELPDVTLEKENQDLKEILEIALQITAQLDLENIVKNVAWSFVSKFKAETVTFLLPGDIDETATQIISYRGTKRETPGIELPSLLSLLAFLEKEEYSQIQFSTFRDAYPDKGFVGLLGSLAVDMIVPLRTDKGVIGLLLLPKYADGPYGVQEIQYITRIVRFAAIAIENSSLFRQATTDRMTGLYSHHFFEKALAEEMERARRYKTIFSLVILDIDHFKAVNDTHGHLQGDRIIKGISKILSQSIRQVDLPARYGGEEFAVILPGVDVKGASVVAERLRKRIGESRFPCDGFTIGVTISLGVAEYIPEADQSSSDVLHAADKALYKSKENGRNRVSVSTDR
jgi:two-component system cell cycle response regulator